MTNRYESFTQKLQQAIVQVGATSGDHAIVAAPGAGKSIWLVGYRLTAKTAVGVQWRDTAASTYSGTMYLGDGGGVGEPTSPYPVAKLTANKGLALNIDTTTRLVGGHVSYRIIE